MKKLFRQNSLDLASLKIFDIACDDIVGVNSCGAFVLQAIFKIMEVIS